MNEKEKRTRESVVTKFAEHEHQFPLFAPHGELLSGFV